MTIRQTINTLVTQDEITNPCVPWRAVKITFNDGSSPTAYLETKYISGVTFSVQYDTSSIKDKFKEDILYWQQRDPKILDQFTYVRKEVRAIKKIHNDSVDEIIQTSRYK